MRTVQTILVALWLTVFPVSARAVEAAPLAPTAKILNADDGGFAAARNLQLAVALPPELAAVPLAAGDFSVSLRPVEAAPGGAEDLPAAGVFLWRVGGTAFLDVRVLPELRLGAHEYRARVTLNAAGRSHSFDAAGVVRNLPGLT
ncbi:MAG: hypothetical protein J6333_12790, partial [Planctomycetes bacterium]|nr:hypothetical protein [Planctomycetota bacterium]